MLVLRQVGRRLHFLLILVDERVVAVSLDGQRLHCQVTPVGEQGEVRECQVERRLDYQVILGRERDELLIRQ